MSINSASVGASLGFVRHIACCWHFSIHFAVALQIDVTIESCQLSWVLSVRVLAMILQILVSTLVGLCGDSGGVLEQHEGGGVCLTTHVLLSSLSQTTIQKTITR